VKVSRLEKCIEKKDWEHVEIRKDCLDAPLVLEAISRKVFPAQGDRKGSTHEEVELIERRQEDENAELRYFFGNMPQDISTLEMLSLFHEGLRLSRVTSN